MAKNKVVTKISGDLLDNWQVPEEKVSQEIEYNTFIEGNVHQDRLNSDHDATVQTPDLPIISNIPGVSYEIL